jgi:hypothetical protein
MNEFHQMKEFIQEMKEENKQMKEYIQKIKEENQQIKEKNHQIKEYIQEIKEGDKQIKEENHQMKEEIHQIKDLLQQTPKSANNENALPKDLKVDFIGHFGIIWTLKKFHQYPVIVTSSDPSLYPEYVLEYNTNNWRTDNSSDAWICFQFPSKKILLTGYLLRVYNYYPRGWKLEGSLNGQNWQMIDQKSYSGFNQNYQDEIFTCQTSTAYSYFRFMQTQQNSSENWSFYLNLVEFSGPIFFE